MRTFWNVFRFEFLNYAKNKVFVGITIFLVLAVALGLTLPPLFSGGGGGGTASPTREGILALSGVPEEDLSFFQEAIPGYAVVPAEGDEASLTRSVENGTYTAALLVAEDGSYTYIVQRMGLYENYGAVEDAVTEWLRVGLLRSLGADEEQVERFLTVRPVGTVIQSSGEGDQFVNFIYTYVLIFVLYFIIVFYGQMVATSVATEKSSRAMELLITSADTKHLLFGKVLGTGCACLGQFVLVFGCAFLFYGLNAAHYASNYLVQSLFNMPLSLLLYAFVFLLLGFFLYAFLYGALASVVSKQEELNTAIMPVTIVFIIAFMAVVFSMSGDSVDSLLMKVLSFIPLTSPMAMFTRIAMGSVSGVEILVSVVLLVAGCVLAGRAAAGIYRMGVLMYGQPPKLGELFKMLRKSRA